MILGQEQDTVGGKFSSLESFRGRLTRLNLWDTALDEEIFSGPIMTSCQEIVGDMVDGQNKVFTWADISEGVYGAIEVKDAFLNVVK